jgi:hypothetical protein
LSYILRPPLDWRKFWRKKRMSSHLIQKFLHFSSKIASIQWSPKIVIFLLMCKKQAPDTVHYDYYCCWYILCNTDGKYIKEILEHDVDVSFSNFNYGFNFWFSIFLSHFINFLFWFVQPPTTSKGPLRDEQLLTIPARHCHFLMCEFISPHGAYHVPDGHIAQFPALCDYIEQRLEKQLETHRKFKEICECL